MSKFVVGVGLSLSRVGSSANMHQHETSSTKNPLGSRQPEKPSVRGSGSVSQPAGQSRTSWSSNGQGGSSNNEVSSNENANSGGRSSTNDNSSNNSDNSNKTRASNSDIDLCGNTLRDHLV